MSRKATKFSHELLKELKGTICCNCGLDCKDNIIFHHVVPVSIGGNDAINNIVPVCSVCHGIIHFAETKALKMQSDLIKAGLERARAEGKQIGRKKVTFQDLPENFGIYVEKVKENKTTVAQASRELGISRPTFYKYQTVYNNYYTQLEQKEKIDN